MRPTTWAPVHPPWWWNGDGSGFPIEYRNSGPTCSYFRHHGKGRPSHEEDYVEARVIEQLIELGLSPMWRVRLDVRNVPDVVCLTVDKCLIVECKRDMILPSDIPQAQRYFVAARTKWPERTVTVALAAPRLSPKLPPATPEIWYAAVQG